MGMSCVSANTVGVDDLVALGVGVVVAEAVMVDVNDVKEEGVYELSESIRRREAKVVTNVMGGLFVF